MHIKARPYPGMYPSKEAISQFEHYMIFIKKVIQLLYISNKLRGLLTYSSISFWHLPVVKKAWMFKKFVIEDYCPHMTDFLDHLKIEQEKMQLLNIKKVETF